jgi:hypothetical protein
MCRSFHSAGHADIENVEVLFMLKPDRFANPAIAGCLCQRHHFVSFLAKRETALLACFFTILISGGIKHSITFS